MKIYDRLSYQANSGGRATGGTGGSPARIPFLFYGSIPNPNRQDYRQETIDCASPQLQDEFRQVQTIRVFDFLGFPRFSLCVCDWLIVAP